MKYKGFYICKIKSMFSDNLKIFRVKLNPKDSYAIHHGSFNNVESAKKFIDEIKK